jgi:quinol monooxygenase YgiN
MMTNSTSDDSTAHTVLTLVATTRAQAGKECQLKEVLTSLIEPTRADPGLITYELYQDTDDAAQFCFLETWESADAHDQHVNQPHTKAFTSREAELIDGGILVHRLRLVDRC